MIKELLADVAKGELSAEEAYDKLKHLPFENIGGFVRLDSHRRLRTGFFEVIFGQGKSIEVMREIAKSIVAKEEDLLITKTTEDVYLAIKTINERIQWHSGACAITFKQERKRKPAGNVLILTGGTGDIPIAEEAGVTLEMMDIETNRAYDVGVAGIHRLFDQKENIEKANCIVVVAGMDGALASVVAGLVAVPIVAVPTSIGYGASFGGLAALLSMLNACAPGVACVNIDNGFGAGYLAGLIVKKGDTLAI
ncbi:nickel pincer cofactor biosynthesis protein LarB [bacterium]|nr:nickel pincer cofactor biosynthesis protein LarB [bacterium]MBU1598667.1 nickel pincer cofactor biosynthesis protein LarB [bacterium]